MRYAGRPAFHLEVREGLAMARYFAFLVVGCAFTFGAVAMVETHVQASNPAPQFAGNQNVH
jgi:hypothetical protein